MLSIHFRVGSVSSRRHQRKHFCVQLFPRDPRHPGFPAAQSTQQRKSPLSDFQPPHFPALFHLKRQTCECLQIQQIRGRFLIRRHLLAKLAKPLFPLQDHLTEGRRPQHNISVVLSWGVEAGDARVLWELCVHMGQAREHADHERRY